MWSRSPAIYIFSTLSNIKYQYGNVFELCFWSELATIFLISSVHLCDRSNIVNIRYTSETLSGASLINIVP